MRRGIYVEIRIRAPVAEVWERTQTPELHEQWDLRFTGIEYLPRDDAAMPQRFRYSTRIGFGRRIEGDGETTAERAAPDGRRTSALRFSSDDALSLIREGAGYWQYRPDGDGTVFLTAYDYTTRWGIAGRAADLVFRPLIGWATAWSFDRLRMWIEDGTHPRDAMRAAAVHGVARVTLAAVFVWQGIVPKLLAGHADELRMLRDGGVPDAALRPLLHAFGWIEVLVGIAILVAWRARWLLPAIAVVMAATLAGVVAASPWMVPAPFSPVTLNACVAALAVAGAIAAPSVPYARHALRRRPASP